MGSGVRMANSKSFSVNKLSPSSIYGNVAISSDGTISVAAKSQTGERTIYSIQPPNMEYLAARRLSHNRISAM